MNITTISPQQLHRAMQSTDRPVLIDVRTPAEFCEAHVANARNVPLDRLNAAELAAGRVDDAQPLFVICRSGSRGRQACEKLQSAGVVNVCNVEGGTLACEQAGLPIVRGQKAISLERQVRIAAGSLVLLGSVLALLVSPYWIGLAAFVGAGLIFAGVTDTCGMAMLLARMPWNQVTSPTTDAGVSATAERDTKTPSCCA